jgi:hypothetical protein
MTVCMNDSETKVWLDSRSWFMALCVDSLTLVEPCFLCSLQDRNKISRGHHLLISQSQMAAAAASLERKANVWLTLLQTNPIGILAYKSCVKPFFMFVIFWHSKCGFVFTGWNSQSATCPLLWIYRDICSAKRWEYQQELKKERKKKALCSLRPSR